jgi:hypothetical protein
MLSYVIEIGHGYKPKILTPKNQNRRKSAALSSKWRTKRCYFIVGMTNSAPSFMPEGQRAVTVFALVKK